MEQNDLSEKLRTIEKQLQNKLGKEILFKKCLECSEFKKDILFNSFQKLLHKKIGEQYKISRGLVLCGEQNEKQTAHLIDVIIYENNEIYAEDNFVIVESNQVKAIFKLIDFFEIDEFYNLITDFCKIKSSIKQDNDKVFAGIVAYPHSKLNKQDFQKIKKNFEQDLQADFAKNESFVDCVSFNKIWFMKKEYFDEPNSYFLDSTSYYFYELNAPYIQNVSSYNYLIGNLRKHLGLDADDFFLYPDSKMEAHAVIITLKRTKR